MVKAKNYAQFLLEIKCTFTCFPQTNQLTIQSHLRVCVLLVQSNHYIHIQCSLVNVVVISLAHPTCNAHDFKGYQFGEIVHKLEKQNFKFQNLLLMFTGHSGHVCSSDVVLSFDQQSASA